MIKKNMICQECIEAQIFKSRFDRSKCMVVRKVVEECPHSLELEVARFQRRLLLAGRKGKK